MSIESIIDKLHNNEFKSRIEQLDSKKYELTPNYQNIERNSEIVIITDEDCDGVILKEKVKILILFDCYHISSIAIPLTVELILVYRELFEFNFKNDSNKILNYDDQLVLPHVMPNTRLELYYCDFCLSNYNEFFQSSHEIKYKSINMYELGWYAEHDENYDSWYKIFRIAVIPSVKLICEELTINEKRLYPKELRDVDKDSSEQGSEGN